MQIRKWLGRSLWLATVLTSPLVLVLVGGIVMVMLDSVLAFGLPPHLLEAVNKSGETVWITPLRRTNTAGNREAPGQYALTVPAIPAIRQGDFRLAPGASLRIRYYRDHFNMSEIVVRDAAGNHRMLPIDRELTETQIIMGLSDRFDIPPLAELPAAPGYVVAAVEEEKFNTRSWGLFSLGFIPVIFMTLYFRVRLPRRARHPGMVDIAPAPGT